MEGPLWSSLEFCSPSAAPHFPPHFPDCLGLGSGGPCSEPPAITDSLGLIQSSGLSGLKTKGVDTAP